MVDKAFPFKLKPFLQGDKIADAVDVETTDSSDVQSKLDSLSQNHGGNTGDLSSLQSKVDALYPLTPDVNILTQWADIYDPSQAVEEVDTVDGYTSLIDFRATDDKFESAGVTYTAGTGVSEYTGLSDDLHRAFGFQVSAVSNLVLLSIDDGGTLIPFIDMTDTGGTGRFRVNNFIPARAQDEEVTGHVAFATLSAGTGTLSVGGSDSTYTIPDYPANTTNQTRTADIELDVLINGSSTGAGGGITLTIPNDVTAQSERTATHTFFTGFPTNRTITATITYEFRVSGMDLVVDLNLDSAPSGITLSVNNLATFQSYTASQIIPRVDQYITLQDAGGDFTFTGEHELLIAFHPRPSSTLMDVVPVVVDSGTTFDQLNDARIAEPSPGFDEIEVPDTIQFRSFLPDHFLVHSDLQTLLGDRATKWSYGLARLNEVTEHAVTEPIDLAVSSKIAGIPITISFISPIYQSTGTGTGQGELVNSVVLPPSYDTFTYIHITERDAGPPVEWRHVIIETALLASGDVGAGDNIRVQGNTDLNWTEGTRTLTLAGGAQEIWRLALIKI